MEKERLRKYIITSLKTGVAVLVVWYLFKSGRLTKESFTKLFNPGNIPFIVISGSAFLTAQILASARLILLLRTTDFPLRLPESFKLTMIGNFFNMVIPGMVGGDIVKGFYLFRSEEESRGRSSGMVVMDRMLGLLAIVFIGGVSIIYLLQQNASVLSPYRNEMYIGLSAVGFLAGLSLVFLVLGRNERVRERLKRISAAIFRRSIFYYMTEGFGVLVKRHRTLVNSFSLSVLIQLLSLAGLILLGNIASEDLPGAVTLMAVSAIVILLGVIPVTPGNIGWTELIAAFSWSAAGSEAGAETFLYWRIVIVLCSLPGGVMYLLTGSKFKNTKGSVN